MVAGGGPAVDGASLVNDPLRVDRNAETEKKWTGGQNVDERNVKAPPLAIILFVYSQRAEELLC